MAGLRYQDIWQVGDRIDYKIGHYRRLFELRGAIFSSANQKAARARRLSPTDIGFQVITHHRNVR